MVISTAQMNKSYYAAPRCPGTLKDGFSSYNPSTLRSLFNGKSVFHVLPEPALGIAWEKAVVNETHFGEQQWFRMHLKKNVLVPDPKGGWMLKTVFSGSGNVNFPLEQAANEHLCLQLAAQVFELETVPNALMFFPDGQPALICKYLNSVYPQNNYLEGYIDFVELMGATYKEMSGRMMREYSFQHLAVLIDKLVSASLIAKERFFAQVVFSWLVSNGEAHLKNYGLVKTDRSDYVMAPVMNVMCTQIHQPGPEISAPGGLFAGDRDTAEFREYGHYTRNEFSAFGARIGLLPNRVDKILNKFVEGRILAVELIEKAFLPDEVKSSFRYFLLEKLSRL